MYNLPLHKKYKDNNPYQLLEGMTTTSSSASFSSNKKVNNELFDKTTSKLFSNVTSNVIQSNTADTAGAVGSTNTIFLNGVKCRNIRITDVSQDSTSKATVSSQTRQKSTSNVSSEITQSITKKITSSSNIRDTDLSKYDAPNITKLKQYMPPQTDLDKILSFGSIDPNTTATIDNTMKQAFNLDANFQITPSQEVTNNIGNSISNANLATCKASANSQNQLILSDISCNDFTMDKIKHKAFAELVMNCVFDQQNTTAITTQINTQLKSQYDQIYSMAGKNCTESQTKDESSICSNPDLLDTWVAASIERMALVAGTLPEAKPKPPPIAPEIVAEETKSEVKTETKPETKTLTPTPTPTPTPAPTPTPTPEPTPPPSNELTPNQILLIGGISIIVILMLAFKK
jgi:hypothetical protein